MRVLMIINIVLLAAGPILLLILAYTKHVVMHGRLLRRLPSTAQEDSSQESIWWRWWNSFKAMTWLGNLWRLGKFWVALVIGIGLQVLLVVGYIKLNPFVRRFPSTSYSPLTDKFTYQIVYSHPYLVLVSTLSLIYLSTVLLLDLPVYGHSVLPEQQQLTVLFQTYTLTWLLLLASTIVLGKLHIGGLYFISAWNIVVLLGAAIGCLEAITGAKGFDTESVEQEEGGGGRSAAGGTRYDGAEGTSESRVDEEGEADPTEATPLIRQRRRLRWSLPKRQGEDRTDGGGAIGWWILQLLIVVPVPVILLSHVGVLMMGAMSQTLADGSSPVIGNVLASAVLQLADH